MKPPETALHRIIKEAAYGLLGVAAFSAMLLALPVRAAEPGAPPAPDRSGSATPSLETILALHIAWLGGEDALAGIQTMSIKGRLEQSGLSGSFQTTQRRDGLQRTDYDLGVIRGSQGIGRDSAWVMDGSGRVEPMGKDEAKVGRRAVARSFGGQFLRSDGPVRQDLGTEERQGQTFRVIRFAYPDGDTYDLFLDPIDGANPWGREHRDTETIWHRFEDWRMQDGVRFAFRTSEFYTNSLSNRTVTLESVALNTDSLEAGFFDPPRSERKLYSIDGGAPATEWIPMTLARGAYIYLRGSINGVETDLLLDSGAGMTVLDRAFAAAHGIQTAGEVVAQGTVGESTASFASGVTIRVGALEMRDLTAAVIDLSEIAGRIGRPLPVIFGKEVFHSLVVDLDYPASRIRFLEATGFHYDGPGRRLAVQPAEGGHKELEITIEDLAPIQVRLDTGSGAALDLFGPYAEASHILDGDRRVSEALAGGVGGIATQKVTSLRAITIAGYSIPDVPVGIVRTEIGAFSTKRAAGNLGAGILKRFRVVFDYAHDCLWIEQRPGSEGDPFERNRSGLITDRKGGALEVLLVAPGSPAESTGWKVGARIVAVDGVPVGTAYDERIDRFGLGEEGRVVRLTLEDGSERLLTLARYY